MYSPALLPPTKDKALTSGWSHNCLVVSKPPLTTFKTPGGKPKSFMISQILVKVLGTLSEGFNTKVLPRVMA